MDAVPPCVADPTSEGGSLSISDAMSLPGRGEEEGVSLVSGPLARSSL
jgi:hypothetical protein